MSRRSRTTLTFTIKLPLPSGATAKAAQAFLVSALQDRKAFLGEALAIEAPSDGMASIQLAEVLIKQTGRETVYL